jgi:DNA-binding MarR family transcriptional regulator
VETINSLREQVRDLRRQLAEALAGRQAPAAVAKPRQPKTERPVTTAPAASVTAGETPVRSEARDDDPTKALPSDDPAWAIVKAMGETGYCLRATIAQAAGVGDSTSGYVREMFGRLKEAGLISEERPATEAMGRTPYLVVLTERGREAYRQRYGQEPAVSIYERLKARHKSVDHTYLNIRAAAVLEKWGYEVDLFPRDQEVDGGTFAPDLVAAKNGRVFYVECERDTRKDPEKRTRKWEIYHQVTGGDFYIIVPNKGTQNAILSEIGQWAYFAGKRVEVHICTLALLHKDAVDVWTLTRRIRPRGARN